MQQNLFETILSRRTIHGFTPERVPSEVIEKAITCAIHAPIHRLTYPWRFYWAGPELRERIAGLHDEFKRKKFSTMGGELLVVGLERASNPAVADEDYASLGCALQNMALYLWDLGYGTKWSTGVVSMHPALHEMLGTSEDKLRLCGFFWIGRFDSVPDKPARPSLDKFLFKLP